MLTVLFVPPGKDGHMIDTFLISVVKDGNVLMGLADPELQVDLPCIGNVETENFEGEVSERVRKCVSYCMDKSPDKTKSMIESLGELKTKHGL